MTSSRDARRAGGPVLAVLDTCVLYPATIRDTLLLAAEAGAFQLRWTDAILTELRRNLVENRAAPAGSVDKMLANFAEFFDDGRVTGFEHHIPGLKNDPKDRHVLAAALEAGAGFVVTENLKDFPPDRLPDGIVAISVDDFLGELLERSPAAMVDVVWTQALRKRRPPVSVERIVGAIGRLAPRFAATIRSMLDVRTDAQMAGMLERLRRVVEKPGALTSADVEEMSVAFADLYVLFPDLAAEASARYRPLGPVAVRKLSAIARTGPSTTRAEAVSVLRARGLDPATVDIDDLSDDEILALLDRSASTSH